MTVYFDNAATTSVSKAALDAMLPCLTECYGNPSSIHEKGREAEQLLDEARITVAGCLGARPEEVFFTSGGSEADNWAITQCAALGAREGKRHIISTTFEHHAVLHTLNKLEEQGFEVTLLPVYEDGIIRLDELEAAIRADTALVTIMYANNEIGTIQPVAEIGALCRERGVLFHTDAVQAAGHLPIDVQEQNIDLLSLSGHKFHGPKGVGALYCRRGVSLGSFIEGGGQERGKRAGTENLAGIRGMAAALREAVGHLDENMAKTAALRDKLIAGVMQIPACRLNGDAERRLPGNANFRLAGVEGESLLLLLDMKGICASAGSACTAGSLEPSHVLLALGLSKAAAQGSLRLTLDEANTEKEVDYVLEQLPGIVRRLREMSPAWQELVSRGEAAPYAD